MSRRSTLMSTQEKVAAGLAGKDVKVIFGASRPMANVLTKTIKLPPVPDDVTQSVEIRVRAWTDHESGHIKHSSKPWPIDVVTDKVLKNLAFSLEDCRVDRENGKMYPGTLDNRRRMFDDVRPELDCKNVLQAAYWSLYEVVKEYFSVEVSSEYWASRIGLPQTAEIIASMMAAIDAQIRHVRLVPDQDGVIAICREIKEIWKDFFKGGDPSNGEGDESDESDKDDRMSDGGDYADKKKDKDDKKQNKKDKPKSKKSEQSDDDDGEPPDDVEETDDPSDGDSDDDKESDEDDKDEGKKPEKSKKSKKSKKNDTSEDDEDDGDKGGDSSDDSSDDNDDEGEDGDKDDDKDGEGDDAGEGDDKDESKDKSDSKGSDSGDSKDDGDDDGAGDGSDDDSDEKPSGGKDSGSDDESDSDSKGSDKGDKDDEDGEDEDNGKSKIDPDEKMNSMTGDMKSLSDVESDKVASDLEYDEDETEKPGYLAYTENDLEVDIEGSSASSTLSVWSSVTGQYTTINKVAFRSEVRNQVGVLQRRLIRDLQTRQRMWVRDRIRGVVDDTRLARVNTDDGRVFKRKLRRPMIDTAVTLLLDLSGSMEGPKEYLCAQLGYAIAETLSIMRVPFEALGFTTGLPGRSRAEYFHRLSQLKKIVIKPFSKNIRTMNLDRFFSAAGYHGNGTIEGEALLWAAQRIAARNEARKIIITICDGETCGGGGADAGFAKFSEHLVSAVKRVNKAGIETIGVGIMTDAVKQYYPRWVVYNNISSLLTDFYPVFGALLRGERKVGESTAKEPSV